MSDFRAPQEGNGSLSRIATSEGLSGFAGGKPPASTDAPLRHPGPVVKLFEGDPTGWNHWMLPPERGAGFYTYSPARFAEWLIGQGYGAGREGVAPTIDQRDIDDRTWRRMLEVGQATYTYFALGRITGRIKIGQSKDPWQRMSTLPHSGNGEPADLLATRNGKSFEGAYHVAFASWLTGNEWFAPHPDILAEIERLATSPSHTEGAA